MFTWRRVMKQAGLWMTENTVIHSFWLTEATLIGQQLQESTGAGTLLPSWVRMCCHLTVT